MHFPERFLLLGTDRSQWRNEAPGAPATPEGAVMAPNRHKNVGQFCKITCATSKSARLV